MPDFLTKFYDYYYIVLILQGICVYHSMRRGTQSKWIWIIVFLPLIGCLAYIFTEIIKKNHVDSVQDGVTTLVNPNKKFRELESRFKFTDTFANRVALADAYLEKSMYEQAIELYEPALTGIFHQNASVIKNLISAYFHTARYEDIVQIAPRISSIGEFHNTKAHSFYAFALEQTGNIEKAENEYKKMNHRFSNYESRYNYGDFLLRINRKEDALKIFRNIVGEAEHMNRVEKRNSKIWITKAQQELSKIATEV